MNYYIIYIYEYYLSFIYYYLSTFIYYPKEILFRFSKPGRKQIRLVFMYRNIQSTKELHRYKLCTDIVYVSSEYHLKYIYVGTYDHLSTMLVITSKQSKSNQTALPINHKKKKNGKPLLQCGMYIADLHRSKQYAPSCPLSCSSI